MVGRNKQDVGNSIASSRTLYLISDGVNYARGIGKVFGVYVSSAQFNIRQLNNARLIKEFKPKKKSKKIFYEINYPVVVKHFYKYLDEKCVFSPSIVKSFDRLKKNKLFHRVLETIFKHLSKEDNQPTLNEVYYALLYDEQVQAMILSITSGKNKTPEQKSLSLWFNHIKKAIKHPNNSQIAKALANFSYS